MDKASINGHWSKLKSETAEAKFLPSVWQKILGRLDIVHFLHTAVYQCIWKWFPIHAAEKSTRLFTYRETHPNCGPKISDSIGWGANQITDT